MATKDKLAKLLEDMDGEYVSGSAIAEKIGITRSAIWKNIRLLEDEGYVIEAVTNRGYKLAEDNDVLSKNLIEKYLKERRSEFDIQVFDSVESTNNLMKENAQLLPEWSVIAARTQSKGRGRSGRAFCSPAGSGVYISILQRPKLPAEQAVRITTASAVAACRAMEEVLDIKPEIKWVNDVFVNGKKVCGILTEASFNMENGELDWAIMGIGINVYEPEGGFPEDIRDIAGPIADNRQKDLLSRLTAHFLIAFKDICRDLKSAQFSAEYRKRSFLIGRKINVLKAEGPVPAVAIDVDDESRLIVEYADGEREVLSSGEVSVRQA